MGDALTSKTIAVHEDDLKYERLNPAPGQWLMRRVGMPMAIAGAALSARALASDRALFGSGYLLGFCFVWSVTVGALFYLSLHYITHAVWSSVYRRIVEMLAALMPLLAVMFIPVLFLSPQVFAWLDPDVVRGDPAIAHKAAYLNLPFFLALAGQWLDLHWIIMPEARVGNGGAAGDIAGGGSAAPLLPWQEIGPFLLLTGVAVLVFGYLLTKMRPVAVGDPMLEASRRFHL